MAGMTGLQLLSEIVMDDPTVAVIMITGYPSIQSAVEATRKGVYQYLEKPVDRDTLLEVVDEVFQRLATLKRTIIGDSPATKAMMRMILKVAPSAHTVLILGESGTGKELVAREIHQHSPAARPAVPGRQLRGADGNPAGKRTLWPREGILHRRPPDEARRV